MKIIIEIHGTDEGISNHELDVVFDLVKTIFEDNIEPSYGGPAHVYHNVAGFDVTLSVEN